MVDPADYAVVLEELAASGETSYETRQRLAAKSPATQQPMMLWGGTSPAQSESKLKNLL